MKGCRKLSENFDKKISKSRKTLVFKMHKTVLRKLIKTSRKCSFCRTIFDEAELLEFAKLGSYLEYDLFGTEMLNYPFHLEVDMPSDSQRVKA